MRLQETFGSMAYQDPRSWAAQRTRQSVVYLKPNDFYWTRKSALCQLPKNVHLNQGSSVYWQATHFLGVEILRYISRQTMNRMSRFIVTFTALWLFPLCAYTFNNSFPDAVLPTRSSTKNSVELVSIILREYHIENWVNGTARKQATV